MPEEWRPVVGYEGLYEVSNLGRVRGLKYKKGEVRVTTLDKDGYVVLGLSKNGKTKIRKVHVMVCEAFNGLRQYPWQGALHRDDIRDRNLPENLYWGDQEQNLKDMKRNAREREVSGR